MGTIIIGMTVMAGRCLWAKRVKKKKAKKDKEETREMDGREPPKSIVTTDDKTNNMVFPTTNQLPNNINYLNPTNQTNRMNSLNGNNLDLHTLMTLYHL